MLKVGDQVYLEDSSQVDVGFMAWAYINQHRTAIIKAVMKPAAMGVTEKHGIKHTPDYALEWPETFFGGINCHGNCLEGRGQFVNEQHLSLNFEASYDVVTIPNIFNIEDKLVIQEL